MGRFLHRVFRSIRALGFAAVVLSQSGCGAVAWLAAVGTDSARTGDVRFGSFEESWTSEEQVDGGGEGHSLGSVVVLPVEGDEDMGGRLAQVLRAQTALRVEGAIEVGEARISRMSEADRATEARRLAQAWSVDAVLFVYVDGAAAHPSDWGWKEKTPHRLFLHLVDRDGHLLWKTELPFTIVKGSKPPLEEAVQSTLALLLMDHVRDLGLDDRGYLPKKIS